MVRLLVLGVLVLLLAGCASPPRPEPLPAETPAPRPHYDLNVRVSQETADGPALAGVEVQAFPLDEDGKPDVAAATARATDGQGTARFSYDAPTLVAVRATAPGWTREGTAVRVGEHLQVYAPLVVSERDLFLPLYQARLDLTAAATLMTGTVAPDGNGSLVAPATLAPLVLPAGVEAQYMRRLSAASVQVVWDETPTDRADLAAGLAWGDRIRAHGPSSGPGLLPGPREAVLEWTWTDRYDRSPVDPDAGLQAAAILGSAAVGDVPLDFAVTLRFTGREPVGLPAPCHLTAGCEVPIPPV